MQIVNIHKQADLTKNNKLDSSIVYWKGHATIYICVI